MLDRSCKGIDLICARRTIAWMRGRRVNSRPLFLLAVSLLSVLLFSGCAGTPEAYRTRVERFTGRGELTVVVEEPRAWKPAALLVGSVLEYYGMDPEDAENLLKRSDRMAYARYPDGERLALSGSFPRIAVSAIARRSRKAVGAEHFRIVSPMKGIVLVSLGEHGWLEDVAGGGKDGGAGDAFFSAGSLPPGGITVFADRQPDIPGMADNSGFDGLRAGLVPAFSQDREGYETLFRLNARDETWAVRLSSSVKTALFVLSRDKEKDEDLQKLASKLLSERAIIREGREVQVGPFFVEGNVLLNILNKSFLKSREEFE